MGKQTGRASKRLIEFLDVYKSRNSDTIENAKAFITDQFFGFGTALHEKMNSPEEFIGQLEKEIFSAPGGFKYSVHWMEEQQISDDICCVHTEVCLSFKMEGKIVDFDPVRMTCVMKEVEGEYYIVNWHASFPDSSRSDEIFPGSGRPKRYEEISVLFTDFVGFTNTASTIPARKLVNELNDMFVRFDEISIRNGLDKIKTIGDSYMAVAGLDEKDNRHAIQCVNWAKEAIEFLKDRNKRSGIKWEMRVGIHTGQAVGGVAGKDKLAFDLWGDTINITSHLERNSLANKINVSAHTYDLIRNEFDCEYRGKIDVKGKGSLDMYFVKY